MTAEDKILIESIRGRLNCFASAMSELQVEMAKGFGDVKVELVEIKTACGPCRAEVEKHEATLNDKEGVVIRLDRAEGKINGLVNVRVEHVSHWRAKELAVLTGLFMLASALIQYAPALAGLLKK